MSRLARAPAAALALAACAPAGVQRGEPGAWSYTISASEDRVRIDRIMGRVCFDGAPPPVLVPASDRTAPHLAGAWAEDGRRLDLDPEEGAITTAGLAPGSCVRYALRAKGLGRFDGEGAAVLELDRLLFRPPDVRGFRGRLAFDLPAGLGASTPATDLDWTALRWQAHVALGRFERLALDVAGSAFDVAILPGPRRASREGIARWLDTAGRCIALVHGRFPVPRVQVVVLPVPADGGEDPVVFGMATRGGGPAVLLLLSEDGTDDALLRDWVAPHELFHLGMPFLRAEDAWLAEGVTMYYSETLRGRIGAFSPEETWRNLERGLERGRRGGSGRTLADESRAMSRTGEYRRVYWAGAALALRWDVAIRKASGNARSLDDALAWLARETLPRPRRYGADEVIERLDRWWGSPLFSGVARRALRSPDFPDVRDLYEDLGVAVAPDGRVTFVDGAPLAAIRDALVTPRPAPASSATPRP
jgi:hypothetical protein